MGQPQGEAKAEHQPLPGTDHRSGERSCTVLPEKPRQRIQAHLRAGERVSHEVQAHRAQVTSLPAEPQRTERAADSRKKRGEEPRTSPGRRHTAFRGGGAKPVTEPGCATEHDSFEPPRDRREVTAEEAFQRQAAEEMCRDANRAAAERTHDHQGETTKRSEAGLAAAEALSDAGRAHASDHESHHRQGDENAVACGGTGTEPEHEPTHESRD